MPGGRRHTTTENQRKLIVDLGKAGLGAKRIVALRLPELKDLRHGVVYRVLKQHEIYSKTHAVRVRDGLAEAAKKHTQIENLIKINPQLTDTEIALLVGIRRYDTVSRIRGRISSKKELARYRKLAERKRRITHSKTLDDKRASQFLFLCWKKFKLKADGFGSPVHKCAMCKRKWYRTPDFYNFRNGMVMNWCKPCERMSNKLKYQGYAWAELHPIFEKQIWVSPKRTCESLEEQLEHGCVETGDCVPEHLMYGVKVCRCGCGRLWPNHESYFHSVTQDGFTVRLDYSLACAVPAID